MKRLFSYLIFIFLFVAVITTQYFFDKDKKHIPYTEPLVFRPEIVRAADLGLHNAAADLEWLAAIQYFGGGESRTSEKVDDYLFLSTDLDPKFAYPYAFGALILPAFGQVNKGIEIGLKGIANNVPDYRIPYYTATTYFLNKEDSATAAKYFDIAAYTPGAPDGIKKVAANFGIRSDKREQTKQIWTGIYESTKDEVVKERAKNYLIHFEIMDLLDQASAEYYKRNGKYPADINDLVTNRILTAIPPDPFGMEFTIDETGKAQVK